MYQQWSANPSLHVQVLAAVFGKMRCETYETVHESQLTEHANSYAKQVLSDLKMLARADEDTAAAMQEFGDKYVILIFTDPKVADRFCKVDSHVLVSQYLAVQIPPPGHAHAVAVESVLNAVESDSEAAGVNTDDEAKYTCDMCAEIGIDRAFQTKKQLLLHCRHNHGQRALAHLVTKTNQCPVCMSCFQDRHNAFVHVR
jgi:hypothetical protein